MMSRARLKKMGVPCAHYPTMECTMKSLNVRTFWMSTTMTLALITGFSASARADIPLPLNQTDAAGGIRESLAQGVSSAIAQLGKPDGFLRDQAVKILLPKNVQKLADAARKVGANKYVDDLEMSMNRAAEKAVPAAADIFASAVKQMSVTDALNIVRGADDAGTQYFRKVTAEPLRAKFLPIVTQATGETGVTQKYKTLNQKSGALGKLLGGGQAVDLDSYITDKAMDGLYYYVAQKEKDIRKNPLGQTSDLLRRVFGRK
jgi:hypothetical protein